MAVITGTAGLTVTDYVNKTIGQLRLMYYLYIDKFGIRPTDMEDIVDGLLYLDIKEYVLQRRTAESKSTASK